MATNQLITGNLLMAWETDPADIEATVEVCILGPLCPELMLHLEICVTRGVGEWR